MPKWKLVGLLATLALLLPTNSEAKKRPQVRIVKQAPIQQPADVALAVVPPALVVFDIVRRTSCDPRVAVATGPGDPGFDPKGPKVGNFLIPAIYTRCNSGPAPTWR